MLSTLMLQLMDTPVQLRILALTATPGCKCSTAHHNDDADWCSNCCFEIILIGCNSAKQQTIQHVIDNLQISTLEYRNETDHDVLPFVHERKIELIQVLLTYMNNWVLLYAKHLGIWLYENVLGFHGW